MYLTSALWQMLPFGSSILRPPNGHPSFSIVNPCSALMLRREIFEWYSTDCAITNFLKCFKWNVSVSCESEKKNARPKADMWLHAVVIGHSVFSFFPYGQIPFCEWSGTRQNTSHCAKIAHLRYIIIRSHDIMKSTSSVRSRRRWKREKGILTALPYYTSYTARKIPLFKRSSQISLCTFKNTSHCV